MILCLLPAIQIWGLQYFLKKVHLSSSVFSSGLPFRSLLSQLNSCTKGVPKRLVGTTDTQHLVCADPSYHKGAAHGDGTAFPLPNSNTANQLKAGKAEKVSKE